MLFNKIKGLLIAAAILPCFIQPASAHVIWFEYKNGEYDLLYGHPEEGPQAYDVNKFTGATVYDINRQKTISFDTNQDEEGLYLTTGTKASAITASLDNGYYATVGDNNYYQIQEDEISNYQGVRRSLKYTKAIYDWSDTLAESFDLPLEIQPLENPFAEDLQGNLLVRVLSQGSPVAEGLTVEYQGQVIAQNPDGTYYIPVGQEGLTQAIEASYSISLDGITTSYETSFTAQTIPVPEPTALLGLSLVGLLALHNKKLLLKK